MTSSLRIELPLAALVASACANHATQPSAPPPQVVAATPSSANENPPAPPPAASGAYSCTVAVEALGERQEGRAEGSGTSTTQFQSQADQDACAKLRAAANIDCADSERYLRGTMSSVKLVNGKGTVMVVVKLTPILAVVNGTASSDVGGREACLAAVENACKTAPGGTECTSKNVACEEDSSGKVWTCGAQRRRLNAQPLVPSDPFSAM